VCCLISNDNNRLIAGIKIERGAISMPFLGALAVHY
jgi:hypothetical protein